MMKLFKRKKKQNIGRNPISSRMYESANSNLIKDIFQGGGDIDQTIESQSTQLVRRCREAYANNDYVKAFASMACTNVIGHKGIRIQVKLKDNAVLNGKIEKLFKRWSKRGSCDVTGQMSFIDIQLMCLRSLLISGEFFVLKHVIDGKLQLQLIDNLRIDVSKRGTINSSRSIINGIEVDQFGKPHAYYFLNDDNTTKRIPADKVIHGYIHEHIGQKRGIPAIATALTRLSLISQFETAAVDNAKTTAKSMGFFSKSDGHMDYSSLVDRESTGIDMDIKTLDDSARFHVLESGYEFKGFDSNFPSTTFAPFKESILKAISSSLGYGVSYLNLGNDLKGASYSSARQGLLSERDSWRMLQTLITDSLVEPIYTAWIEVENLSGRLGNINENTYDSILEKTQFQKRSWAWVDPLKDAKGTSESINNLTMSIEQSILDAGGDVDETRDKIRADYEFRKSLGLSVNETNNEEVSAEDEELSD
jgi:lambda family phage portal protein